MVGLTILLGVGIVAATSGKKKKPAPSGSDEGDVEEVLPTEESLDDLDEDEIEVVAPGPDGTPGGGDSLVVDTKEAEQAAVQEAAESAEQGMLYAQQSEQALPGSDPATWGPNEGRMPGDDSSTWAPDNTGTAIDKKINTIASQEGRTVPDAVDELVRDITDGATVLPISAEETSERLDPNGTVALARLMLARENMPGWKEDMQDEIGEWQSGVGLVTDGKFGIKSAAKMASEVGLLPLVRFWPKNAPIATSLKDYQGQIGAVINDLRAELPDSAAQIIGLQESVKREEGQAYGVTNPEGEDTLEWVEDTRELIGEQAEAKGRKELTA